MAGVGIDAILTIGTARMRVNGPVSGRVRRAEVFRDLLSDHLCQRHLLALMFCIAMATASRLPPAVAAVIVRGLREC
ncbi:hypothetical protein AAFG13_38495 [Bradyrhizobium sp. B124]|uniref:hypothetical protein n=1 Tax=Bradyrhizobium sp. B124 TaxID=3140245 RepID=UPI0031833A1D